MSFKKNAIKAVLLLATLSLVACGGSSGGSKEKQSNNVFVPESVSLNTLKIIDVLGQPIVNAEVTIEDAQSADAVPFSLNNAVAYTTDTDGNIFVGELGEGDYHLTVDVAGTVVINELPVPHSNSIESATVAAPLIVKENGGTESLQKADGSLKAIIAVISGVVYGGNGPIENAEVSISGGVATNGAVSSDVTDENGQYFLLLNVSNDYKEAMQEAKITVKKAGFKTNSEVLDVTSSTVFLGKNYLLSIAEELSDNTVYHESFDQTVSDAVCGEWTSETINGEAVENLWHLHESGIEIQNQAYVENKVKLAPNDTSDGYIPAPYKGSSCWYGQAEEGNIGQGNFLGNVSNGGSDLGGGTSATSNSGAIVSPILPVQNVTAPLALNFYTWWEVESVNPNKNGFDIMQIEYSLDDGATWTSLKRLNPFSDPYAEGVDRAPLPFSNLGFNQAPKWLSIPEAIDVSVLAGEDLARLRFTFKTMDSLYNGFRGWLVDEVKITQEQAPANESIEDLDETEFCEFLDGLTPGGLDAFLEEEEASYDDYLEFYEEYCEVKPV